MIQSRSTQALDTAALPQVQLAFGASNGAWDDRDLIDACDAAMEEFHAHHPGPGSWLDKVTAAQTNGKPLPGVKAAASSWHEPPTDPVPAGPSSGLSSTRDPLSRKRTRKSYDGELHDLNGHAGTVSVANPYAAGAEAQAVDSAESPCYAPESPCPEAADDHSRAEGDYAEDGENGTALRLATTLPPSVAAPIPPTIGARPPEHISAHDAISYAMTSQYWAGYWMGVAQTLGEKDDRMGSGLHESALSGSPAVATPDVGPNASRGTKVTRRQFDRPRNGTLKR